MKVRVPFFFLLASCAGLAQAVELSEQDYFSDLPEVLTVTRLVQPLSETPGAVTIIDRETIRRSGAREVVDLLRLVPGYLVAGYNGANPNAAYHAPIDDYGIRNLVMIDGRAVYSTLYLGGTHRGMMGVLLEDIERIEVLRGSNSAAYGANAMFGVINIVTRHAADTRSAELSVSQGGGVADRYARLGWGGEAAQFRLSAGRRSDNGYRGAFDDKTLDQMHLRGDMRPAADQEASFALGATELRGGDGFADEVGNPERVVRWRDVYLQGSWRKQISAIEEIKLAADYDQESLHDVAPYVVIPGLMLDFSGQAQRLNLELQHQLTFNPRWRAVWGLGYKYEHVDSKSLFAARSPVSFSEKRLFGNLEWKPNPWWTLNAGGFWGDHSDTGAYFAPRLMANLHLSPDYTLRAGVTNSMRAPTLFELKGDVRYTLNGTLIGRTVTARGNVEPERLTSNEIGFFGNLRALKMTLDVRAFHEQMNDLIAPESYRLTPAEYAGLVTGKRVDDYTNTNGLKIAGLEYQWRWQPWQTTEIWLNQTALRQVWDNGSNNLMAPTHTTSIAWFQQLPSDTTLSLAWHSSGAMTWRGDTRQLPAQQRVDIHLAKRFHMGTTRAEVAMTVQAADGAYLAFYPYDQHRLYQERRAFGTLRLEF